MPRLQLLAVLETQVKAGQLADRKVKRENWLVGAGINGLQMLLDQDRTLESAASGLALLIVLVGVGNLLLLDADEHLREQIAFQFLP
jgi:hypothetical protein